VSPGNGQASRPTFIGITIAPAARAHFRSGRPMIPAACYTPPLAGPMTRRHQR
jgi:hypothetical protein